LGRGILAFNVYPFPVAHFIVMFSYTRDYFCFLMYIRI
jgi:hypothetical protein